MTWDGEGIDPWLPARLAAEARITGAERRLYNEWLASMGRWLVKAKRQVYANGAVPDPTGVFTAAPEWAREMDRLVDGPVKDTMGEAYRELFGDGYRFDTRPAVVEHLAQVRNRMVRTSDDVFGLVAGEVAAGATSGASIPEIRDRVDKILSSSGTERWAGRATTVARSEVVSSLNAGRADSFEAVAEELGEPMESMWISTIDLKTRPSHALADQQRVPVGQPFTVGGASLRFPGDPFGPAEECANCRCTTILVGVGEDVDLSDRQYTDDDWEEWRESRQAADVDGGPSAPLPPKDLETKARERQASIDKARGAGSAAAELDEVVGNLTLPLSDAGRKAIEYRIGSQVARNQIPSDVADDLRRALADGDLDRMSAVAWRHAETQGAHRIGKAGEVAPFDRKRHQPLDETPAAGSQVLVTRPGVEWDGDGGLLLDKARVDALDDVDLFNARLAQALTDQNALDASPAGLRRTHTGLTDSQGDTFNEYLGLPQSQAINGQLRAGDLDPKVARWVGDMDKAMEANPLSNDVAVYRGMYDGREAFGDRFDGDLTGAAWVERGYISTSASEKFARFVSSGGLAKSPATPRPVVMRLLAPKGTGGVHLTEFELDSAELLLQRGLKLTVVKDHGDVDGVRQLDVEVSPATKASRAVKTTASKVAPQVSKLEVRDTLKGGTPAQLTAKFKAEWVRVTGRDIDVDVPPRAAAETLREHYEGLLQVAERFPLVQLKRVDWGDLPGGVYAEAITDGPPGIRFGAVWLRGRAGYLKSLSRDVEDHWHPSGFGSPADIAVHEFGHLLRHTVGDAVDADLRRVLKVRAGELDLDGPDAHSHAARSEVSGYASTDLDELVAEALLDVMANGAKASRLSRQVVDVVEDAYKVRAKTAAVRAVRDDAAALPRVARVDVEGDAEAFDARMKAAQTREEALSQVPRLRRSGAERAAVVDYKSPDWFGPINDDLRGLWSLQEAKIERAPAFLPRGVDSIDALQAGARDRARELDGLMARSQLGDDIVAWRGVRNFNAMLKSRPDRDLTGVEWREDAYVSTTVRKETAQEFAQGEDTVLMRVRVPKGTGALEVSGWQGEAEVLLQRGLKLRIVKDHGVVRGWGFRLVDVDVVDGDVKIPAAAKTPKAAKPKKPKAPKVAKRPKDVKLEIRPELAGTPANVAVKFAAEWKRITGRDIEVEVPKGASGATLREHYEGLLRAAERFPFVDVGRVDWWDNPAGEYAQILAKAGARPVLQFGSTWLGTTARTRYLKSLLNDAESGWSPPGFSSPGTVALREFGRILHRHSEVDGDAVAILVKAALRRHAEAGDHRGPDGDLLQSLAAREGVSGTASNGTDDLVADAFADVLLNGPRASALSREVFDILEDAYKTGASRAAARRAVAKPKPSGAALTGDDALAAPFKNLADMTADGDRRADALWYRTGDNSHETPSGLPGAFEMAEQMRRRKLNPEMKQRVKDIDSVMADSVLSEPIEVYRGMDPENIWRTDNLVGKEFTDKAFVSTSTAAEHASWFGGTVMRIRVPAGVKAIRMADRAGTERDAKESEILLDRGLKFRITAQYGRGEIKGPWGGAYVLDAEVVMP